MSEVAIGTLCLLCSLVLIQTGMHIGVALMLLSFVGVWAIKGLAVAGKLLGSSVSTSIASDAYAVIPMFVMMGLFVSATNMGRDTFEVAAVVLRRIRGALGSPRSRPMRCSLRAPGPPSPRRRCSPRSRCRK
jgi:TRAP-type mannitol/chloroaromatic compound transport system permease large subunit